MLSRSSYLSIRLVFAQSLRHQMTKTAPPAPSSPAGPPRLVAESGLDGVGGFDSASTPPPPDPFGALTVPDKPGPPPVGGPGSVMAEGGPAAAGCEEDEPMKDLVAAPAYKLAAEISADMVFPTSPRTILLARKGIKAIAIENKTLTAPNRIIWLDPMNALSTPFPPSTAFTLFICKAVMRACRIA